MNIVEHTSPATLIALVNEIAHEEGTQWGVAAIKRDYLRPMTNEAFMMAVKHDLEAATRAYVFFIENRKIYIAWRGVQKSIFRQLRSIIETSMLPKGLDIDRAAVIGYIDPRAQAGEELKKILEIEKKRPVEESKDPTAALFPDDEDEDESQSEYASQSLKATTNQIECFQEARGQKPYHQQLHFLVVEDQAFSQKLLCDILRGARLRNNNETPIIDSVAGIHDAWKIYLKRAPDLTFIDLGLADGSGHTLAAAIKGLDPQSQVIIVTANNYEEEINVARQNNVDGFIAKPYNKKQILDCVDKYISTHKTAAKSWSRNSARVL
jgi:CheY-like chemotaxis protein